LSELLNDVALKNASSANWKQARLTICGEACFFSSGNVSAGKADGRFRLRRKYRLAKKARLAQNFFVMRLFCENCLAKSEFGGC
jgi:hypothetical protein